MLVFQGHTFPKLKKQAAEPILNETTEPILTEKQRERFFDHAQNAFNDASQKQKAEVEKRTGARVTWVFDSSQMDQVLTAVLDDKISSVNMGRRPSAPISPRTSNAKSRKAYSDALKEYKAEMADYNATLAYYSQTLGKLKDYLKREFGILSSVETIKDSKGQDVCQIVPLQTANEMQLQVKETLQKWDKESSTTGTAETERNEFLKNPTPDNSLNLQAVIKSAADDLKNKQEVKRLQGAESNYQALKTYLDIISGFSNYDNLADLQTYAQGAVNAYSALSSVKEYETKSVDLLIKYRALMMPCLRDAITADGRLAVDDKNVYLLTTNVNYLTETVVLYNTFDQAVSSYVLRGTAILDIEGFKSVYSKLRGDGEKPSIYQPYLNDLLTSRYGKNGEGFVKTRELLGMGTSSFSPAEQYFEIMDPIVHQTPEGIARMDKAYYTWRSLSERYPDSLDNPVAVLSGSGAGGQTPCVYIAFPGNTRTKVDRNTFDFASQLVAANTFGITLKYLTPLELASAINPALTLPAGTQAMYFEQSKFFDRVIEYNFINPTNVPSPMATMDLMQAQDVAKGDFYTITARYLSILYFLQKDPSMRYDTIHKNMLAFRDALYEAGSRVDDMQNRVADPRALTQGSVMIPLLLLNKLQLPYMPNINAMMMGRLPYVSAFEGMNIEEIAKFMSLQQSGMFNNFLTNCYYADEYIKHMISVRTMEITSRPNFLGFLPAYETVLGLLASKFNSARKSLADLTFTPISGDVSGFFGEGRQSSGLGLDVQGRMQGVNPAQYGLVEGFFVPKVGGIKDYMVRAELNQTEVAGANVWNFMARIDKTINERTSIPGVTVTPITNTYSVANLDLTWGDTDGMCRANFWGVSSTGDTMAETYHGVAFIRQSGHWYRVVIDHDALMRAGLQDSLDHYFVHVNTEYGKGYTTRIGIENNQYDYKSQEYGNSVVGGLFVGRLPPVLDFVAGGAVSPDKEIGTAAGFEVGSDKYITAMGYSFHDRDIVGGGMGYGAGGLTTGGTSRGRSYRLYEMPTGKGDVKTETDIGAIEYHVDKLFRLTLFGGESINLQQTGTDNQVVGGAEVVTPKSYTGGAVSFDNNARKFGIYQASRLSLRSFGETPFLSNSDYAVYMDLTRGQPGLAYGGITTRLGKKGSEIGSITLFGTSNQLGSFMTPTSTQSIAGQTKSLIDDFSLNPDPSRDQQVEWLISLRGISNAVVRQAPETIWSNNQLFQFGIGYSSYRGKKDRGFLEDIDGMLVVGGIRNPDGTFSQAYSFAADWANQIGMFVSYRNDNEDYSFGGKYGFGSATAGLYFSRITVPTSTPGQNEKMNMTTVDAAGRGIFGEKSQTSAALSIGEGSYKFHFFQTNEGEEKDYFGQLDVYRFGLPAGSLMGWEASGGFKTHGFDVALVGLSQIYTKFYGGIGQTSAGGKFTGTYLNIGGSVINRNNILQFDIRAMLSGIGYWNAGLTYSFHL